MQHVPSSATGLGAARPGPGAMPLEPQCGFLPGVGEAGPLGNGFKLKPGEPTHGWRAAGGQP